MTKCLCHTSSVMKILKHYSNSKTVNNEWMEVNNAFWKIEISGNLKQKYIRTLLERVPYHSISMCVQRVRMLIFYLYV